jgi:predicted CoA-substrate-specific enzyme activase
MERSCLEMIVAGCDIGSLTAKAVILGDDRVLAVRIGKVKSRPEISAREIMEEALKDAGLRMKDIECSIGTGYGGKQVPFAEEAVSEIACHARGALWLLPSVRTVIDIGGQDCKVMKLDREGKIVRFATNDKCAAGTGRFMEVMARVLNVGLDELGDLSGRAKKQLNLASTCTVWAQAEVIRKINEGERVEDIGGAVNNAMANRIVILANTVGVEDDVCMTGGVSKNRGVVKGLERLLDIRVKKLRLDPQAVGALGAAVIAGERRKGGGER